MPRVGKVYLVGAGPGDPGLITLRGVEALRRADVVVYDHLAHPALLEHAPRRARRVYAGKESDHHALGQREIEDLLVRHARAGRTVVRLKGGDPYVFGRGGEEATRLRRRRVPFEVVPGVTAASGASAFAGIPLTDRRAASSVTFVTARPGAGRRGVDVHLLPRDGTLVFYMGVSALPGLTACLLAAGFPRRRPAAVVEWATLPRQRTIAGTLATIAGLAAAAGVTPPALTIVGDVVRLRRDADWFGLLPLRGTRVVLTRPPSPSDPAAALERLGAEVIRVPVIRTERVRFRAPRRRYDWIAFTSATAVDAFLDRADPRGARLAVVGPGTAAALERRGLRAHLAPAKATVAALASRLAAVRGRVLHPCADLRSPDLRNALGRRADEVVVYRVRPAKPEVPPLKRGDILTFASSETVRRFVEAAGVPEGVRVVAIGPQTAKSARALGLRVDAVARVHTFAGLVDAVLTLGGKR